MTAPLLDISDLRVRFRGADGRVVTAVDGVDLSVAAGSVLGLVGESGCGKSTTARLLMRLIEPDAGRVLLDGRGIGEPGAQGLSVRDARRQMQMVFQDSFASLAVSTRIRRVTSNLNIACKKRFVPPAKRSPAFVFEKNGRAPMVARYQPMPCL